MNDLMNAQYLMTAQHLAVLLRAVARTGYAFVPPTPETHLRVNARPGNEDAWTLRDVFGWNRPFAAEAIDPAIFSLLRDAGALEPVGARWKSKIRIATLNDRFYLHSAFPTRETDAVFFGPDTYRFVRAALAAIPSRHYTRAVDIGCGSGAGGLAIADARDIAELCLTDINPQALNLARANAEHCGRTAFIRQSDILQSVQGEFDLIVANPPYLADSEKRAYRDGGGDLGLDLGLRIVREGITRLAENGILFVYTGVPITDGIDPFRAAIEQIVRLPRFSLEYSEIDPDVFGEELDRPAYRQVDRIAAVSLTIKRLRA